MKSDILQLVAHTYTRDKYGVDRESETLSQVFCRVDSISQSEWFEGGRSGLNPAYRFTIFAGDYNDEETVDYAGERYAVYRTYQNGDYMELYTEHKEGD